MSIVELHEVKRHLHYADDSNDASLKSFIVAADAIIKNYITDNFGSEFPSAIKQAALLLIEYWEQHRKDGGGPGNLNNTYKWYFAPQMML